MLHLQFVAFSLRFEEAFVLEFEVVDVGLSGVGGQTQPGSDILKLVFFLVQFFVHHFPVLFELVPHPEVLFALPLRILIHPDHDRIVFSLLHLQSELELSGCFGHFELVLVRLSLRRPELVL